MPLSNPSGSDVKPVLSARRERVSRGCECGRRRGERARGSRKRATGMQPAMLQRTAAAPFSLSTDRTGRSANIPACRLAAVSPRLLRSTSFTSAQQNGDEQSTATFGAEPVTLQQPTALLHTAETSRAALTRRSRSTRRIVHGGSAEEAELRSKHEPEDNFFEIFFQPGAGFTSESEMVGTPSIAPAAHCPHSIP